MAQIRDGKIRVVNGSTQVRACWEVLLSAMSYPYFSNASPGGGRLLVSSGAIAQSLEHTLSSGVLVCDLLSGTDLVAGQTINGPTTFLAEAGITTSGSTASSLEMTGESWAAGTYDGYWVVIRADGSESDESPPEWRRISQCLASPCRLVPDTPFTVMADPSFVGKQFQIYANDTATIQSLRAGTPQDWVTLGVTSGHFFAVDSIPVFVGVQSAQAMLLTLSAAWGQATQRGVGYSITRDFSTNRGYPMPRPGDKHLHQILAEAIERIDIDIQALYDEVF